MQKLKVCILGTGNIGTDLLIKTMRSKYLECTLFSGRNLNSKGMSKALRLGIPLSDKGIDAIIENPNCCDLVFDATSAISHFVHAPILKKLNKIVIDMTPAKVGSFSIPAVNINDATKYTNLNMITCGGQASIPMAYAISKVVKNLKYIEVISTISSKSAGPGTRINIDEYIETTEKALSEFTRCQNVKTIINLNPALPSIDMNTTIYVKADNPDMKIVTDTVNLMLHKIRTYVPKYDVIVGPEYDNGIIMLTIRVRGMGDYLPKYAGNLDIINCAAIAVAEEFTKNINKDI